MLFRSQRVQYAGMAAEIIGEPGRGPGDLRHQPEQTRIGEQHGKDLHARGQPGQKAVEMGECRIRVGGFGQRFEKRGMVMRAINARQAQVPRGAVVLANGRGNIEFSPHEVYEPALCIAFTVISCNWFGDYVRSKLDQREAKI